MTGHMLELKAHCKAGDDFLTRLKYAKTRKEVAKYVCSLRPWYRELQPLAEACGLTLGAGNRLHPKIEEFTPVIPILCRPLVVNRHGKITEAQRIWLVVTVTVLSRLAPHLANAKPVIPKDRGGRPPIDPPEIIEAVRAELLEQVRQHRKRNKTKAIDKVISTIDFEEDTSDPRSDTPAKMFGRLFKLTYR